MIDVQGAWCGYFGRRAEVRFTAACEHCGTRLPLDSYDTREWFRLGPLPVYPLTAYRILNACSLCGFSRRLPLEQYRRWALDQVAADRAVLDAHPADADMRLALAWRQYGLGLMWEALATLAPLLVDADGPAAAHHVAGLCHRALGQPAAAIAALSVAVDREPGQAVHHLDLGRALLAGRGDVDRALGHIEAATREAPEDVDAWVTLAAALAKRGRWAGAVSAWEQALALRPGLAASPLYKPAIERARANARGDM
ncbi:MAG: tetratricopeptide repeat protein [Armatimonadetes bacterium]|nr:tetratricopeptide repeat protein [Armatimonadota bacterium]